MSKILTIYPEKCLNCRSCELICSFNKTGELNPKDSAVDVLYYGEASITVPVMCMQCEDAACMKVCPVGAISRDESGAVVSNPQKCVVCKICISACPLGNISFSPRTKKIVKCNLCGGEPKCAEICPSGAIRYVESTEANKSRKRKMAERFKALFEEANG